MGFFSHVREKKNSSTTRALTLKIIIYLFTLVFIVFFENIKASSYQDYFFIIFFLLKDNFKEN